MGSWVRAPAGSPKQNNEILKPVGLGIFYCLTALLEFEIDGKLVSLDATAGRINCSFFDKTTNLSKTRQPLH